MLTPEATLGHTTTAPIIKFGPEFIRGRVLDVGCGNKPYKRLFPDSEWVGLDKRPVGEVVGDVQRLPFEDESFDSVVCTNVLHQVESPLVAMREMARVLKYDGFLLLVVPNCPPDDDLTLWGIKQRGVDYLCAAVGLKGVILAADGRTFSLEWQDVFQSAQDEVSGFLGTLDKRYPTITFAIVRKEHD